ncbi:hypothetical protein [Legionella sp. W05-934-2]|jgi:hypothetical protein|uniref:hypothetical protein n=1 Tax=Legionella sp. W05-934-2 TaxID=1198649 RepID=UPI00346326D2
MKFFSKLKSVFFRSHLTTDDQNTKTPDSSLKSAEIKEILRYKNELIKNLDALIQHIEDDKSVSPEINTIALAHFEAIKKTFNDAKPEELVANRMKYFAYAGVHLTKSTILSLNRKLDGTEQQQENPGVVSNFIKSLEPYVSNVYKAFGAMDMYTNSASKAILKTEKAGEDDVLSIEDLDKTHENSGPKL